MSILRKHIEILNKENASQVLAYHLQTLYESCKKNIESMSKTQFIIQQKANKDKDTKKEMPEKDSVEDITEQESILKLDIQLKEQKQKMQHAEKGLAVLSRIKADPDAFKKEDHEFFVMFASMLQKEAQQKNQISIIGVYITNLLHCHSDHKSKIAKFHSYLKMNRDLLDQQFLAEGIPLFNFKVPQNRIAIKNRFGSPEQEETHDDVKQKEEYLKLKGKLDQRKNVLENYNKLISIIVNLYYFREKLSDKQLKFIREFAQASKTAAASYHRDPNFASVTMRFLKSINASPNNTKHITNNNLLQVPTGNVGQAGKKRKPEEDISKEEPEKRAKVTPS